MLSLAEEVGGLEGATSRATSPLTNLFIGTVGAAVGAPLGRAADGDMVDDGDGQEIARIFWTEIGKISLAI